MKRQDYSKISEQPVAEINAAIGKLTNELAETSMKRELGQLKNTHAVKSIRHDIARLKSLIRQKELASVRK